MSAARVARVRRAARRCTPRARRPGNWASTSPWDCERAKTPGGLLPGARRHPVRDREVAGRGAVRRHPVDGDQDRRPRRRQGVRRRDPRRLPRQDAGLQPVPLVQLGHHRHDRRRDARLPRGARQDGLRLQLHDLRRPPDRRRRRRGVRHRAAAGRHAGAGAPAAQDAPGRVALPHTADPGRRPAQRRRAGRVVGAHRDHQVDGQGLDPAPAPGPDRGAEEAARGMAGAVERALPARRERCASSCARCARVGEVLELGIYGDGDDEKLANVVVDPIKDRTAAAS